MRRAMAAAPVGDDVIDRDPTVQELEARTTALVGQEAGLFMPSGSMSNLVALMTHLRPGDRFLAPRHAHILSHELGTAAWIAGGIPLELPWSAGPGVPSVADVQAVAAEEPPHHAYYELVTRLVCLENTHNHAGGHFVPWQLSQELSDAAHQARWRVHLDGARLWHAAAAQSISPAQAAVGADSVSVCFSKGLGAPVGSMLCSSREFIDRAWRSRKALGGGMRQSGVLAAAALVALDEELPRIDEDRRRAVELAAALRGIGLDAEEPATNIVMAAPPAGAGFTASQLAACWQDAGVGCLVMGPAVRLVTHRDIDGQTLADGIVLLKDATARLRGAQPNSEPVSAGSRAVLNTTGPGRHQRAALRKARNTG
jgi:threonine aldolase